MPGTRTTTSVGPILGARYPIDAELVSDEVNLNECDRTASGIVYKEPHGQGKFGAAIVDADGNERHVVVGATAAVAHASRHVVEEPLSREPSKQGNVGEKPLPSTPKKKKNGNPFETLYDADEFPDSTPRPPEYTAPRSSTQSMRACRTKGQPFAFRNRSPSCTISVYSCTFTIVQLYRGRTAT